jgi:hypothetical protein
MCGAEHVIVGGASPDALQLQSCQCTCVCLGLLPHMHAHTTGPPSSCQNMLIGILHDKLPNSA